MSLSISFPGREIAVFWLYEFALRLKHDRHHVANDNFQLIILVEAFLYFYKMVTLRPRQKWLSFCRWLCAVYVRIIDCPLLSMVTITVLLIRHYSFQPSCHWSHTLVPNTLGPKQNGPLCSSHMFKTPETPDLFMMIPLEYELPNNIKISFYALVCCSDSLHPDSRR